MTQRPSFRKFLFAFACLLSLSAGVFANDGVTINEKLLASFKQTFPNAEQVKWMEQPDKYTVNFKENGILTKIDYDKDGNFVSSLRYYSEKNLPVNIICKLQKKYADKKVFGVTEMTTDAAVEYYIKLEDETSWTTVKSNSDGSLQVVEKYKKAA
ncbi:MAG TPA: hypothetical protein VNS58_01680 [Puia sp.]|jgi:hypothetical protein|nr:hypothetical protein [Puia sp.]